MFVARTLSAAAVAAALWASPAAAEVELFDGGSDPGLFKTSIVGFTFGSFEKSVWETRDSFIVQAKGFGGVGRDLLDGVEDFNARTHRLLVEFRFLRNDTSGTFNAVLVDLDGEARDGGLLEDQFQFSLANATQRQIDSGFTAALFEIDERASLFNAGNSNENVANYGLRQFQLQSPFGTEATTHLEVRRVAIVRHAPNAPAASPPSSPPEPG